MHLESIAQSAPCAICQHHIHPDDQNECGGCGEFICNDCPSFGCACDDEDPQIHGLRVQMRALAFERAGLRAQREFLGQDSLTGQQQSRLRLLEVQVESLRDEVNRLDEIRDPW